MSGSGGWGSPFSISYSGFLVDRSLTFLERQEALLIASFIAGWDFVMGKLWGLAAWRWRFISGMFLLFIRTWN